MSTEFNAVYSPRFELEVGGTTYREAGGLIGDLKVETTVQGADLCSFTLNYPFDAEQRAFSDLNWGSIEPGTDVEAAVGWGGEGGTSPVFTGTSQSIRADFSPQEEATVAVSGYGLLHDMMQGVVERSWSDVTAVDVVREVLGSYFPNVEVDGPGIQRNRIIQHGQNDYRFVRGLADEYGFEFYADRDTAHFTPRSSIGKGDPAATLAYGNTLDSFSAEISASRQVETVEVRYWDMSGEREIVGSASGDGEGKEVFRIACDSKEEADRIAEGKLSELTMARATGHGETDGVPAVTAGETIRLEELGDRLSSNYYVTRATHRIGGSGYRTSFEVTEISE